ncbi:MAG: hypothetical protein K0R50_498 [Eubacterium sp.]|nr:hypothetical protein [Eubacterium sp.]
MNRCEQCGVLLEDEAIKCPLCHRGTGEHKDSAVNKFYPVYEIIESGEDKSVAKKVLMFVFLTVISICLLINLLTGISTPWFLLIACPLFFIVASITIIKSGTHAGAKIFFQILALSGLLLIIDLLSGYYRWSVNIVIPFLFIIGTFMITIILIKRKIYWNEYIGYIIAMMFLGLLPVLFYVTGISDQIWAGAVSALYSLLTAAGMLLFNTKKFKNEITRRFHI